jgi:ribonuclease HI
MTPLKGSLRWEAREEYCIFNHNIDFKDNIGKETNKFCELMALKLTLQLFQEYSVPKLQIFEDSLLVIQWIRKEAYLINFTL